MAEVVRKKTAKKASGKKRGRPKKVQPKTEARKAEVQLMQAATVEREKNAFERNFGEGTAFDLDYGKLLIIALCIYIAVKVS